MRVLKLFCENACNTQKEISKASPPPKHTQIISLLYILDRHEILNQFKHVCLSVGAMSVVNVRLAAKIKPSISYSSEMFEVLAHRLELKMGQIGQSVSLQC